MGLDIRTLDISPYSAEYLAASLSHEGSHLNVLGNILQRCLPRADAFNPKVGLVDYGGGNGLLSLLAREAGFGVVVYNDIFEGSCRDAQTIASGLDLEADHYVQGDLGELKTYLRTHEIVCEAICSYDVIEHVYDIEDFLARLPSIVEGPLRIVMSSAANGLNPRIRRRLMSVQKRVELEDGVGLEGRDARRAYRTLRAEIIRAHAGALPASDVEKLADRTRGLIAPDIQRAVDDYIASGTYPLPPDHPTNTCDPTTGNWAEHLMDPFDLARTLSSNGLRARVEAGRYGFDRGLRGVIGSLLNSIIATVGDHGVRLAPHYTLIGRRD